MPYDIYNLPMVVLTDSKDKAMHVMTDAEKKFFNDNGFSVCDFKWSSVALVKPIGTFYVDYISLQLKSNPYRFVGMVSYINQQIPTVHGMVSTASDIGEVEGESLLECYHKLMILLGDVLKIEKEQYIKYIDQFINT